MPLPLLRHTVPKTVAFVQRRSVRSPFTTNCGNQPEGKNPVYGSSDAVNNDNLSSANFGRVTRKRTDGQGREMQIGVRFVF